MKKSLCILLLLVCTGTAHVIGQSATDPILLQIGNEKVTRSEFEKVYRKNNAKDLSFDRKSVTDYLELYVNYKLKVTEAEDLKMDTSQAFQTELAGYRKQLSQPYLTDKEVTEHLLREAYDRLSTDVRASHILIKVAPDALPKDTLSAYNKAMKVRERLVKGGDFSALARETSDDPSAKENGGDLGYFTGLQMVYPFESAAFTTKNGEISMPVRTSFGYHIIKVVDKRPAQGEVQVAHIMVKLPANATTNDSINARTKINEIYDKLISGESFKDLAAKYSDDQSSARNEGILPWFGTGRMVPEFEKAAFDLKKNDEISKPFMTAYGWHIAKRIDKRGIPSYEDKLPDLKSQISRDSRSEVSRNSLVARIKQEYGFTEVKAARDEFFKSVDSSLAQGTWKKEQAKSLSKKMFTLGDKSYTQQDFAEYVENHQTRKPTTAAIMIVVSLYDQYVNETVIAYEESRLDKKYPDFKALMQEYRDGILLFDLTDTKVWSKAVKDTTGLRNFYDKNKGNYMWPQRAYASIYMATNQQVADAARKMAKKKKTTNEQILTQLNKDSQLNITIKEGKFAKGDNEVVDAVEWKTGLSKDISMNGNVSFVKIMSILQPQSKQLEETRGLVISDFQTALEKEWIDGLRKKYEVKLNKEVLDSLIQ